MDRVIEALHSSKAISGLTHNFYRYPARMAPELAKVLIEEFSQPGDTILDPFMGGGTTIIEALVSGRRALGVDLNPLSVFVTKAKSTPLSQNDKTLLRAWAENSTSLPEELQFSVSIDDPRAKNLPTSILQFFSHLLPEINSLPKPRQRMFARCLLLRLGQWAVDCKKDTPQEEQIKEKLYSFLEDMFTGLDQFVFTAQSHGVPKNKVSGQRELFTRSVIDIHKDRRVGKLRQSPSLVVTSPPYPGMHVLYHRWQVNGRRETPAPYWLVGEQDGHGAIYYTLGGRGDNGVASYFFSIMRAFKSVREIISPDALVAQLVAFTDVDTQLPEYLDAMERAGFHAAPPGSMSQVELWRSVPNRKWYNSLSKARSSTQELLLFHRPS